MFKKIFYVMCGIGLGIGVGYGMASNNKEADNYSREHKRESDRIRSNIDRDFRGIDELLGIGDSDS